MRRRVMLLRTIAQTASTVFFVNASLPACAKTRSEMSNDALGSVVKVEADGVGATGFLWPDGQHVVTALHVVDNSKRIVVNFVDAQARIVDTQTATVDRVLQRADLVLLRLQRAQQRRALELAPQGPDIDQVLSVLGFPLNIAGHSSTDVRLRFGGRYLKTILPSKVLLQIKDYPDPNIEVLNLEGNLVPGLSGAPLLDIQGRLCGIADGGIEEGAVGICWGIPGVQLHQLAASDINRTPNAGKVKELFGADLVASVGEAVGSRVSGLRRLRTRTFAQLSESADDGLGLAQLSQFFSIFSPSKFSYDIYQNEATGASVAFPAGASVATEKEFIVARTDQPDLKVLTRVSSAADRDRIQADSVRFERDITGVDLPGIVVQQDPAWSNMQPVQRGSLVVWRRAAVVGKSTNGFPEPSSYLFEAIATNGRGFLGVAAINDDVRRSTLEIEQGCAINNANPKCGRLFERRRVWAQMVLGVQFSSFPV